MSKRPTHAADCPRGDPQTGMIDECTCGETQRREAERAKGNGPKTRITFKKKKRMRFDNFDVFEIRVDGACVGGLNTSRVKIGYSIPPNEKFGLAWKNTWADGEKFATVEDAKRAAVEHLRKQLTRTP